MLEGQRGGSSVRGPAVRSHSGSHGGSFHAVAAFGAVLRFFLRTTVVTITSRVFENPTCATQFASGRREWHETSDGVVTRVLNRLKLDHVNMSSRRVMYMYTSAAGWQVGGGRVDERHAWWIHAVASSPITSAFCSISSFSTPLLFSLFLSSLLYIITCFST